MEKLNKIHEKYGKLPYMRYKQALYLRELIHKHKLKSLCELGHFHGKSSAYMGAILEEQGYGTLHTFDLAINQLNPNIRDLIREFELYDYVKPIVSREGYVWDLADMIKKGVQRFDFCYIDSTYMFESTTMGFVLADLLLDPGSIVIFTNVGWTIDESIKANGPEILKYSIYNNTTAHQRQTKHVRMVCELIVPRYGYKLLEINNDFGWVVYQKKS